MRDASEKVREVLRSGVRDIWYVADLTYNGDRIAKDVPITRPTLRWDGGSQVAGSADCTVAWSDSLGRSALPEMIGDTFAPFGAELQIDAIVSSGSALLERIPIGPFVIEEVPAGTRQLIHRAVGGLPISIGERFDLSLKDYFRRVQRDKFPFPQRPRTTSMWSEVQSLTELPVVQNLPDEVVNRSIAYDEDKLNALDELFTLADAVPHLTPSGAVTARPKAWPSPVDEFSGIASASRSLSSEQVFNRVVVEGKSPTGAPLRAVAEVLTGFMRVRNADGSRSPFGVATYFYQSDLLTTQAKCGAVAASMLSRLSVLQTVTRVVVEPLNPLREIGDVVELEGKPTRILDLVHDETTTTSTVEVQQ